VQESLAAAEIETDVAEVAMVPQSRMDVEASTGLKVMNLVDALEELEDVERVYTNLAITDEMFELYAQEE
jgi:transcriptional/translational regulatory protein YebC/TACO1